MDKKLIKLITETDNYEDKVLYQELSKIKGSEVIDIGFHPLYKEGGLTIDFKKPNSDKINRIVIGFNELGAWIAKEKSDL